MITYIFPGQGAQYRGMGGILFDEYKELTAQADTILGYSIKELCLNDPDLYLSKTQYTQPALYVVNVLSYLKNRRIPDFVAGHSLGEYNALFAAGAFDFATGLELVKKRGELMSHFIDGKMAAVIGLNEDEVNDVLQKNNLKTIDIANYNAPKQIVISGLKNDIDSAEIIFKENKDIQMFVPLNTSGPFHSRYMKEAETLFASFIDTIQISTLEIPVISNVHARPYKQSDIKQNLIDQMTHSVKWTESIRYLMSLGKMEFKEIGPGNVLKGLVRRIRQ